jgi:hypothetical protein
MAVFCCSAAQFPPLSLCEFPHSLYCHSRIRTYIDKHIPMHIASGGNQGVHDE